MSKVIIARCVRCLKPYNVNLANMEEYTPQCPHCKCYGMKYEEIMAMQPEIEEKLKKVFAIVDKCDKRCYNKTVKPTKE